MNILGCTQKRAWFDEEVANEWIRSVLLPYVAKSPNGSFLLIDHYSVHTMSNFFNRCAEIGTDIDYIPAGYTCVLQPIDVGFNSPFKKYIKDQHHEWCLDAYANCENDQRLPQPTMENIVEWVNNAYDKINERSLVKTFLSIGYNVPGMPLINDDIAIAESVTEHTICDKDIRLFPPDEVSIESTITDEYGSSFGNGIEIL
jgi:DDE superfamily endonuclease